MYGITEKKKFINLDFIILKTNKQKEIWEEIKLEVHSDLTGKTIFNTYHQPGDQLPIKFKKQPRTTVPQI